MIQRRPETGKFGYKGGRKKVRNDTMENVNKTCYMEERKQV